MNKLTSNHMKKIPGLGLGKLRFTRNKYLFNIFVNIKSNLSNVLIYNNQILNTK